MPSMILFKADWHFFPTAIVDYQTSNISFLRLVALYKKMGVDNAEFILALYQPELQGVNPFDPDLSPELKYKIRREVTFNPWYYFREVCRFPSNAGGEPRRFIANRGVIALYWSFFNHIDFGLLMPRQTGKSAGTDALMTGIKDIWARSTTINLITKDAGLRAANVERLKGIRNLLPEYIYYPNKEDANNTELLTNKSLNNRYVTSVARNDKVAADKLGRGLTVPINHFDEFAYCNLIGITLSVALASGSAAREEAAEKNQYYGNIYTTTAGSINSRDGEFAHAFLTSGAIWDERYFDLSGQRQLERVIVKQAGGKKPLIYGAFNHRQLGKSDKWLAKQIADNAMSGELADRDMMNIWTTGTEGSPLTTTQKTQITASQIDASYIEITKDDYVIRWYIDEHEIGERMNSHYFVIGLDTSDALGGDNDAIGLVIIDTLTHDVVCTGRFNETNLMTFALFLVDIMVRYPRTILVPERKSSGMSILDILLIKLPLQGIDPFKRIYNHVVDESDTYKTEYREIQTPLNARPPYFYERFKRHFGYNTSGKGRNSRDSLYGDSLKPMLNVASKRVYDPTLAGELLSLTIRNGRIDHRTGQHDDLVVALLLGHWFCTFGRNLNYYGIDARHIFTEALVREDETTMAGRYRLERQRRQRGEFDQLLDSLKEQTDPLAISRIEHQLRAMSRHVDIGDGSGMGIDAMINQAHDQRIRNRKISRYDSNSDRPEDLYKHLL